MNYSHHGLDLSSQLERMLKLVKLQVLFSR